MSPLLEKPILHGRNHLPGGANPIEGLLTVSGTIEDVILATSPGAYYKLDEATGDWVDSADSRDMDYVTATGTVRGVASGYDEGDGELCVTVDGGNPTSGLSGGYVGHTGSLGGWFQFPGTDPMTVSVRVRGADYTPAGTFSYGVCGTIDRDVSGSNAGWGLFVLSELSGGTVRGKPSFRRYNTSGGMDEARGASPLVADTWYRLTGTFDGAELRLYVDDTLVDSDAPGTPVSLPSGGVDGVSLIAGAQGINEGIGTMAPWQGELDSLIVWDRALTPSEVGAIVDATPAGTDADAGFVPTSDGAGHTVWAAPTMEVEY